MRFLAPLVKARGFGMTPVKQVFGSKYKST
jgi:hypothetical protein